MSHTPPVSPPEAVHSSSTGPLRHVSLQDQLDTSGGARLLTGAQALVMLLLLQRERDRQKGLDTGGYVSGYRGSPLGSFDQALWKASDTLRAAGIHFDPGINEDLAATAVWGTQQLQQLGPASVDGVFAMWYGKGPGVDRSGDPIKHGNFAGTHLQGGVLAVFGDDHPGKSSTVAHHSEQAMAANMVPVLYPSNVADILRMGLLGYALSRYSGCWVGLKVVNETIEQTATVDIESVIAPIAAPDKTDLLPPEGVHLRGTFGPARDESVVLNHRLPLVARFARANRLDVQLMGDANARLGLVTAGKACQDTLQALSHLGIDSARASALGLAVYKVGLVWPLEAEGLGAFARDKQELFFIEEKSAFLETQAAALLYNLPARPRIVGKRDEQGVQLLPADLQLEPVEIALVIGRRLEALGIGDEALAQRLHALGARAGGAILAIANGDPVRAPYFCSGCPHNTSTNLPDGSVALAGIGCHGMAMFYKPRTLPPTHMGGEGANWIGMHRFTQVAHVFQNLGDGTYFHSGSLAVRAAVASGANITFKILYNDAVAMTGGQPVDGPISVAQIARQMQAEGVREVVLVSEQPERHARGSGLPPGVEVHHRDALDAVQRRLREVPGCTVLIYEQACAAEKRRRRKRGKLAQPTRRLFIHDAVCEGCGDCSAQSGCIAIEPLETPLGRKRTINQSTCNQDLSCVKGFCPSFVTVVGGSLRRPPLGQVSQAALDALPRPPERARAAPSFSVMVAGIGGTGVITVSAVLAMAAHLEFKAASVYDMTGVAQKNGAVFSHLRIAARESDIASQRIGLREADLVLAFDMLAGLATESLRTVNARRTHFLGNDRVQPSAAFTLRPDERVDISLLKRRVATHAGADMVAYVDATGLATALCGDPVAANLFMVGVAAQRGWLPVGVEAVERAIELNGTQVALNLHALRLGRLWVHDRAAVEAALPPPSAPAPVHAAATLEAVMAECTAQLTTYQSAAYARRHQVLVQRVARAETRVAPGSTRLAIAVARSFARLMAYKDEYEVARLFSEPAFRAAIAREFDGDYQLRLHLAPPLLSRRDPATDVPIKRTFGPWVFPAMRMLSALRPLRGTPLDPFGHTEERRAERALVDEYEATMLALADGLTPLQLDIAERLAQWPDPIRGFGHVKEKHIAQARQLRQELLHELAHQREPLARAWA